MSTQKVDELLVRMVSRVDLFRQLDIDDVAFLLRHANQVSFEPGAVVFEEGDEGHSLFIVTQGAFEVYRHHGGKRIPIATLEPGQHFGEIALLANRPRSASVRALKSSVALRLSKSVVLGEHRVASQLFRNMAWMLTRHLVNQNEEVLLHKASQAAAAAVATAEELAQGNDFEDDGLEALETEGAAHAEAPSDANPPTASEDEGASAPEDRHAPDQSSVHRTGPHRVNR